MEENKAIYNLIKALLFPRGHGAGSDITLGGFGTIQPSWKFTVSSSLALFN